MAYAQTTRDALFTCAGLAFLLLCAPISLRPALGGNEPPAGLDTSPGNLETLQRSFQDVAEQIAPSVVGIRAERRPLGSLALGEADGATHRIFVNGTGTVLTDEGLILTNEHVIQAAGEIDVVFYDGQKLPATLVASDPRSDLAVLHVARSGLRPARLCDWSTVARGQWAITVGNPFGLGLDGQLSVSVGVISNLGRQLPGLGEVDDRFYNDMIQVTAPINPGNSGGPLLNLHGELIGIVTAMHTRAPVDEGVGFAIPITPFKVRVIERLCEGQPMEYGYIGLTVRLPEAREGDAMKPSGVVVERVDPEGPAARAGFQVGDTIRTYNGQPIRGPGQLAELAGQSVLGAKVPVECVRGGQSVVIELVVGQRDVSRVAWMRGNAIWWRGMRVTDLSEDARRLLRLDADACGVVVIDVTENSPAGRAKMEIGDVIETICGDRIQDTLEFLARVRSVTGTLELGVRNGGKRTIVP